MYLIRFDVEICKSLNATHEELVKNVPGIFAIYCCSTAKINEEIIKAAGK